MDDMNKIELSEEELETVVGGYEIGTVVRIKSWSVKYCERCGKSLMDYEGTIAGVRGKLDGKTLYWITRNCCGFRSSVSETAIIG